jgi:hypothetical protein
LKSSALSKAFRADDQGSIPFTRSNISRAYRNPVDQGDKPVGDAAPTRGTARRHTGTDSNVLLRQLVGDILQGDPRRRQMLAFSGQKVHVREASLCGSAKPNGTES